MTNPDSQLIPKPDELSPDRTDIVWQVQELCFSDLPNLYEAVPLLIDKIHSVLGDPLIDEDEKWLYREKEGAIFPLSISFMVYSNQEKETTCLVYDDEFSNRALSTGGIVIIRLGSMDEDIYCRYYAAKLGDPEKIPPIPEEIVIGSLIQGDEGFELDSIFLDWDCRRQFEAAMAVRGFPTEVYNDIVILKNVGDKYRGRWIGELVEEHGMGEEAKRQLLDYNPSGG